VPLLLMGPFILLLFPDGRPPSKRWGVVAWLFVVSAITGMIGLGLAPDRDVPWSAVASILTTIAGVSGLAASALAVVSVVLRFRRSEGVERAQIRWLAVVAIIGALGLIIVMATGDESSLLQGIGGFLFVLSLAVGLPAAIGIAVLRYRLWELDVVVKKTVVALVLTLAFGVPVLAILAISSQFRLWAVPNPIYAGRWRLRPPRRPDRPAPGVATRITFAGARAATRCRAPRGRRRDYSSGRAPADGAGRERHGRPPRGPPPVGELRGRPRSASPPATSMSSQCCTRARTSGPWPRPSRRAIPSTHRSVS
jgi:hypothetical protein